MGISQEQPSDSLSITQVDPNPPLTTLPEAIPLPAISPLQIHEEPPTAAPKRSTFRLYTILFALYLSYFIAALDETILSTSIPTIAHDLHSSRGYAWIVSAYFLGNAAAGPAWAQTSNIWGRKPALLSSVALFAAASTTAALSRSSHLLIAARAVQGTAAAGLCQLSLIIICDLFSLRKRTLFLGLINVCWAFAGGIGPLLGGAFTQYATWRWCFWVNLPICFCAFALLFWLLDVHNPRTPLLLGIKAFDWLGTLSIVGVTLLILLGLDFGGVNFAWSSPSVLCLLIFGLCMIAIFIITEKKVAKWPLIPPQIFTTLSTNATFIVCFTHGMTYIGADYYLPLFLQSIHGSSPLESGILLLAKALPESTVGILTGVLMLYTGRYREIITTGLALLTLGTGLYISFNPYTPLSRILGFEFLGGIGSGALFEAPLMALQAVTQQDDTASATAAFGFTRNIATTISIVLGAVVFQNSMTHQHAALRSAGLNSTIVETFSGANAQANVDLIGSISNPEQRHVVRAAFAMSMRNMWIMYTGIIGVGLAASFFIRHVELKTEHEETKTGIKERLMPTAAEVSPITAPTTVPLSEP